MSSSTSSLALVSSDALRVRDAALTRLQRAVVQQHELILHETSTTALRALFIGVALHRIKESLPYGAFGPWVQETFKGTSRRTISYYMSAAIVFIGELKVTQKELAIAPSEKFELSLDSRDREVKRFVTKARKFIGDLSFSELLAKYGIKEKAALGGARTKSGATKHTALDAEQLYLFARDEIGGVIQRAEELLLKENQLQYLASHPEEIRGVIYALNTLAEKVESAAKDFLKAGPAGPAKPASSKR
jgi:hypothetical protein